MCNLAHILAGATVGVCCKYVTGHQLLAPVLAFTAGFATHILLDLIPHHDQGTYIDRSRSPWYLRFFCAIDIILGVIILLILLKFKPWHVFHLAKWGAIGGTALDFVDNFVCQHLCPWLGQTRPGQAIFRFHNWCHNNTAPSRWFLGIATQVATAFGSSACLIAL